VRRIVKVSRFFTVPQILFGKITNMGNSCSRSFIKIKTGKKYEQALPENGREIFFQAQKLRFTFREVILST